MSAAERLDEFDTTMSPRPWSGIPHRYTGEEVSTHRPMRDEDGIVALRNALPQLIAVVRAAHRANLEKPCSCGGGADCWNKRLPRALAALDDALGER